MDVSKALELIQSTAVDASRPVVTRLEGQPQYVLVSKGDTLAKHDLPPPKWSHKLASLWSLFALAGELSANNLEADVSVWHNAETIQLVHHMLWRRDTATFVLEETDCLVALRKFSKEEYSQPALIKLLRVQMAEAHLHDLILVLRSLNFRSCQQVQGDVQHGSTSMGRSIEQALATKNLDKPLPEDFQVACRYWQNLPPEIGDRLAIKTNVALDVNFASCGFALTPSRDDLITNALWVHQQLEEWLLSKLPKGVAVYHGTP